MPTPTTPQPVNPTPMAPAPAPMPEQKSIVLPIIISVVLTALLVGGGVFAWSQMSLQSSENKLSDQISMLENKLEKMELEEKAREEEEKELEEKIQKEEKNKAATEADNYNEYHGVLKKFEGAIADIRYILTTDEGKEILLNGGCIKGDYSAINAYLDFLTTTATEAEGEIKVDLFTYIQDSPSSPPSTCAAGVILDLNDMLGTNYEFVKNTGKVYEYEKGGYGDVMHYLEKENGEKIDIATWCTKADPISLFSIMLDNNETADFYTYKNPSPIGDSNCIAGVTVKNLGS